LDKTEEAKVKNIKNILGKVSKKRKNLMEISSRPHFEY
jgi:hypothetical protein